MKQNLKSPKLLKKTRKVKLVAKFLVCFIIIFIFSIAVMPWQQTTWGEGRVIAYSPTERQQNISAPLEGRISQWYIQEGSFVHKGDPIARLYDNDPNILENLKAERKATTIRLNAASEATTLAKINLDRQYQLYREGISSRRKFELAKLDYNQYVNAEANIKGELIQFKIRLTRQESLLVKSPMAGYILRRMSGQESVLVRPGDVLAVLVPETKSRAVEMFIDGNDAPLINQGQTARLQFEGWPGIQFSGWPSVAVGTFGGRVAVIDQADNGFGKFRVLIVPTPNDPWPSPRYLRQGVRVSGWIMLSRVSLAYELWRRFNGFPPIQNTAPNEK